jgi:hypothetical protein
LPPSYHYGNYHEILGVIMNMNSLREYIGLHIISLEQDLNNEDGADSIVPYLEGAIEVSKHYLEVMEGYDD